jgi:hypothetical protein
MQALRGGEGRVFYSRVTLASDDALGTGRLLGMHCMNLQVDCSISGQ